MVRKKAEKIQVDAGNDATLTRNASKSLKTPSKRFRRFWRDESGVYGISFLMILPFYVAIMCIALESAFTIVAKFGALHAAQAAVRAAALRIAVVRPEDRSDWISSKGRAMAKKAATEALVPYASAFDPDYKTASSDGEKYYKAYLAFVSASGAKQYVKKACVTNRYASAENRVSVGISLKEDANKDLPDDEPWRKCIVVSLTYRSPYRLPTIGRILGGTKVGKAVVAEIRASASAQIECPRNESGFLGVAIPWDAE